MSEVSVGVLYSAQDLVRLAEGAGYLHANLIESFKTYGVAEIGAVLEVSQRCNWLEIDPDGVVLVTAAGAQVARERDPILGLRIQLRDYIRRYLPPWSKMLRHGRAEAARLMPSTVVQAFTEAALLDGTDEATVAWWDELQLAARVQRQSSNLEVGRRAERLSYDHERQLGRRANWQSLETNFAGYDILSEQEGRPLKIEVKGSELRYKEAACYISRHEWRTAAGALDEYAFDLWLLRGAADLLRVTASEMQAHIPCDQNAGAWDVVRVPYSAFPYAPVVSHR